MNNYNTEMLNIDVNTNIINIQNNIFLFLKII